MLFRSEFESNMKFFVCTLAVGLAVVTGGAYAADKCHLREVDLCAASAAGATKIPSTDADIDKYCAAGTEAKECIDTYLNQCATPIQKEIYSWATKDPLKNTADFCKKGSTARNDYLRHAPCLAKAQPDGKKCVDDIHAALEKLETAKFSDRIPTTCCIYHRYQKCSSEVVEAKCGKEALEVGATLLRRNAGATTKLLCNGFDSNSSQCVALLPPSGTKATGNSKSIVTRLFSAYVS